MAFTVADMIARLRLKPDQKSFDVANKGIEKVKSGLRDVAMLASAAVTTLAVGDFLNFDDALTDLDIATEGAMGSLDDVRDKILDVSDATGVSKEEVTNLAGEYVKLTGDAKAASDQLGTFARVSSATKASAADIAGTAAAMAQQFGMMPSEFESGFSMMVAAGKAGAVELRQLATVLPELGGLATEFAGGKGKAGLAQLTAMLQVVAQGTGGNAAKAKTQVQALLNSLTSEKTKKALRAMHIELMTVDPATGEKVARNYRDIITDISGKGLSLDQLGKVFESVEAKNAFLTLKGDGIDAWEAITNAQMGANDIAEDFAKRQRSNSAKVRKFWNEMKNGITRAIVVIVDHLGIFAAAVASVGTALLVMAAKAAIAKAGSVTAAMASAAAWVAAALPVAALAAAFFAVILVVNDLYSLLMGGDSYIKDFVMSGVYWLRDVLGKAIKGIGMAFETMWNGFVDGMKFAGSAVKEVFGEAIDWIGDQIARLLGVLRDAKDAVSEFFSGDILGAAIEVGNEHFGPEFGQALGGRGAFVTPEMLNGGTGSASVSVGQINVTPPPGGDPAAYAQATKTAMQEFWSTAMRETATELGR